MNSLAPPPVLLGTDRARRALKTLTSCKAFLLRKQAEQEAIIDHVRVFSKRYGAACDELDDIEALLADISEVMP